jgi:GcrA cell cycle regulator
MSWTADTKARMLTLNAEAGSSATSIAEDLNREFGTNYTRNSVIGKLHRLGLAKGKHEYPTSPLQKEHNRPRPLLRKAFNAVVELLPVEPLPPEDPGDIPWTACSLLELKNESCRWPVVGNHTFCGRPEADISVNVPYCAYHSNKATRKRL